MCRIWSLHKVSVDNHILSTGIVADDVIVITILVHETKTSDNIVISLSAYNSCPIYRVYKKKVDNFETALNLAKRLQV